MPTISVLKSDLYHLAGLPEAFSLDELDDILSLAKGELSPRAGDGRALQSPDGKWIDSKEDIELRVELADTNRPDLWSVEGIARQIRDHRQGNGRAYHFFTQQAERFIQVDPHLETIRPFIGGFIAQNNVIDEKGLLSFIDTQETLTRNFGRKRQTVSIGLYNANAITFPLHYRAVKPDESKFEPLPPAMEQGGEQAQQGSTELSLEEILLYHPTGREYAWILEGQVHFPLLLDANGEVLSFPPIINSAGLGRVIPGMTSLLIEATGMELDQCLLTLNILATNLADRGWEILPITTVYPFKTSRGQRVINPHEMSLQQSVPLEMFNQILGERLDMDEIITALQAYGVSTHVVGSQIVAKAPSYRQDYLHPVDVIEDFAISRGYQTFEPLMLEDFTIGKLHPLTEFEDLVRDLMIGIGFEEAICSNLSSPEILRQRMEVGDTEQDSLPPFHGGPGVKIQNVMNRNYSQLRDWILPSLLEIEAQSEGAIYPHKVFEVGEVAVFDLEENLGSRTESRLAGIIAEELASFDSVQSVLYALLGSLGIEFTVTPWDHPSFIPGRVGLVIFKPAKQVQTDEATIPFGFLGELSPQVLTNWGARTPVSAFELSLQVLLEGS